MRVSLRTKLYTAINDVLDLRSKVEATYDELLKSAPDDAAILMAELDARGKVLDSVWAEAVVEMNPLEKKRYIAMLGGDPQVKIPDGTRTPYPAAVEAALERVKKFFPNARVKLFVPAGQEILDTPETAAEREARMAAQNKVMRSHQEAPIVPVKRTAAPAPLKVEEKPTPQDELF